VSSPVLLSLLQLGLSWIGNRAGRLFVDRMGQACMDVNCAVRSKDHRV